MPESYPFCIQQFGSSRFPILTTGAGKNREDSVYGGRADFREVVPGRSDFYMGRSGYSDPQPVPQVETCRNQVVELRSTQSSEAFPTGYPQKSSWRRFPKSMYPFEL